MGRAASCFSWGPDVPEVEVFWPQVYMPRAPSRAPSRAVRARRDTGAISRARASAVCVCRQLPSSQGVRPLRASDVNRLAGSRATRPGDLDAPVAAGFSRLAGRPRPPGVCSTRVSCVYGTDARVASTLISCRPRSAVHGSVWGHNVALNVEQHTHARLRFVVVSEGARVAYSLSDISSIWSVLLRELQLTTSGV